MKDAGFLPAWNKKRTIILDKQMSVCYDNMVKF